MSDSDVQALEPISKTRLCIALGLVTFAFMILWATDGLAAPMIGLPIIASNLVMTGKAERNRPLSKSQLIAILAGLAVLIVGIVLFKGERTQESRAIEIEQLHRYSHPLIVFPVWLVFCYFIYHRYLRSHTRATVLPLVETKPQ